MGSPKNTLQKNIVRGDNYYMVLDSSQNKNKKGGGKLCSSNLPELLIHVGVLASPKPEAGLSWLQVFKMRDGIAMIFRRKVTQVSTID